MCLSVCLSVASHVSKTSEVIASKFDTATTSVTERHHVLNILTLTYIQGHTDLEHENVRLF